jgi:hypothetical protein
VTWVHRFATHVEEAGRGRVVVVPLDVPAVFGKVRGTVNGFPYRSTIMKYGDTYYLGLNGELRNGAGVDAGDLVEIEMELDDAPREVDVPAELAAALDATPAARHAFDALSQEGRCDAHEKDQDALLERSDCPARLEVELDRVAEVVDVNALVAVVETAPVDVARRVTEGPEPICDRAPRLPQVVRVREARRH